MTSPEVQLYDLVAMAAQGLRGGWWARLGQAERRRRVLRRQLEARGLWGRCSAQAWLASWGREGARERLFLDRQTREWHSRMGRPGFEHGGWFLPVLAWALERPFAWLARKIT